MAAKIHGRLASLSVTANTDQIDYTVPAGRKATVTVNVCNRAAGDALIRLAVIESSSLASLSADDYIEYDTPLPVAGVLLRERITLGAGQSIVSRSNGTGQSVVIWGVEEDA